jgi:hypothetical protein
LQTTATVLSAEMLDNTTVVALRKAGFTAQKYTVALAGFGTAPLVQVTVQDPNAAVAYKDMQLVLTEVPKQLQALQRASGAPLNTYITANRVTTDKQATKVYKTLEKLVALLVIVGIIAAIGAARIVESISLRRRRRKASNGQGSELPPAESSPKAETRVVDSRSAETRVRGDREPALQAAGSGANGSGRNEGTS